jgi:8-hydroxy-5-deazaflavin:NADPH oxidoreductase
MNIAVIGAGNIGAALGGRWAGAGHEVVYGVRDPRADKVRALLAGQDGRVRAAAVADSAAGAEVVLLAVPAAAVAGTVDSTGGALNGKILIDATNRVGAMPMHQLDLLRQAAPDSPLFRAFSNLGWENFAEPLIDGQQVDLFYCGDAGPSQPVIDALIGDIGLRPVYLGGVEQAGIVDALTRLWFNLALQQGLGRHLAFKMLSERTEA